ncbi:MAG: hypothetical protein HUU55_07415 [Myxococcales bacterium]|nr:hypothetical protein [Myxococcales bacterium]
MAFRGLEHNWMCSIGQFFFGGCTNLTEFVPDRPSNNPLGTTNMSRLFGTTAVVIIATCTLVRCTTSGEVITTNDGPLSVLAREVVGAHVVQTYDLNSDGQGDVWDYFVVPETPIPGDKVTDDGKLLVRKELDINFDTKIDIRKSYDRGGNLVEEEMDLDFDGSIDAINRYQRGVLAVREMDMNFDGKMDVWKHYEDGQLAIKKRDMNRDGKIDSWEYYKDGKLLRLGVDKDGDGEAETFEDIPQS